MTQLESPRIDTAPVGAFSFFRQRPSLGDIVGSISVALILIPQSIAYAAIAGLPPTSGLVAATVPLIFAAAFVSCPWLQTGPTAMTSLFTFGVLVSLSPDDPQDAVKIASLLALVVGCTRLLMGLIRVGRLVSFLKEPVIVGFTSAAAILILASQLSHLVGLDLNDKQVVTRAVKTLSSIGTWKLHALAMSLFCGASILLCKKIHRLFPGILIAAVAGILISSGTSYPHPVVGPIASTGIQFSFDLPWGYLPQILFSGVVIAVVGFAEPASIAVVLTREAGISWNASRELLGSGVANFTSAMVGGYPIGGSFSRTIVNQVAGSTTSWSGFFTGCMVFGFLPFVAHLQYLPKATLAAIITLAAVRLIKLGEIRRMFQSHPTSGFVAVATLIATLVAAPNIEYGIVIGVVLSLIVEAKQNSLDS